MTDEFVEILGPVVQFARAKPLDCPALAVLFDHLSRCEYVVFRSRSDEGQCGGTQRELKQSAPQRRNIVVVPLWRSLSDDFDLPVGESESTIGLPCSGVRRLGVGQVELGRTGLENYVAVLYPG